MLDGVRPDTYWAWDQVAEIASKALTALVHINRWALGHVPVVLRNRQTG
jgi:hypothetical protein